MAIAMTVGATKIQLLQQRAMEATVSPQPSSPSIHPDLQCLQAGPASSGFT